MKLKNVLIVVNDMFYLRGGTCSLLAVSDGFCNAYKTARDNLLDSDDGLLKHIHPDDYKNFYTDVENACMNGYITKPLNPEAMFRTIAENLR